MALSQQQHDHATAFHDHHHGPGSCRSDVSFFRKMMFFFKILVAVSIASSVISSVFRTVAFLLSIVFCPTVFRVGIILTIYHVIFHSSGFGDGVAWCSRQMTPCRARRMFRQFWCSGGNNSNRCSSPSSPEEGGTCGEETNRRGACYRRRCGGGAGAGAFAGAGGRCGGRRRWQQTCNNNTTTATPIGNNNGAGGNTTGMTAAEELAAALLLSAATTAAPTTTHKNSTTPPTRGEGNDEQNDNSKTSFTRQKVPVRKTETEDDVTFQLDVPGFDENNIMVVVEESTPPVPGGVIEHIVLVHGERTNRLGDTYAFEERFVLDPKKYNLDDFVHSDLSDDVLEIIIGKKPESKPRAVPIMTGDVITDGLE